MSRQSDKITVPENLRDILLEFTINYLLEQPGDIVDFGIEYFTKLRDSRQSGAQKLSHSESNDDSLSMDEGKCVKLSFKYAWKWCCEVVEL